jgi:hypothetical protein
MELLLKHDADINAKTGQYGNLLTTVLKFDQIDATGLLISNKADVNIVVESRFSAHTGCISFTSASKFLGLE